MNQDELKRKVAQAAADHVFEHVPQGAVIGVGTGSTANHFIDALTVHLKHFRGAVSSSTATTARLLSHCIPVLELNDVTELPVYVDGADEIDGAGNMIKGGGGALTREKIVASVARRFICIADTSKQVQTLGNFPLPIEVVPMARAAVARRLAALGGQPAWRTAQDGSSYLTDNGNIIIDVHGLRIADPKALEDEINGWPGVVTVGLFARRGADLCMLAAPDGVRVVDYAER